MGTRRLPQVVLALVVLAAGLVLARPAAGATASRVAGADRYSTAAALSRGRFPSGAPVAYIATGLGWADALTAGAAAAQRHGPVLLVETNGVPQATADELTRLHPAEVLVAGGQLSVSDAVVSALGRFAPVRRLAGGDRYATAVALSQREFPSASTAYVASGESFADALAGVPAAHAASAPMLLTPPGALSLATATEVRRLGAARVVVLGGTGAVSDNVVAQLRTLTPDVTRLAGADRNLTAVAVSASTFDPGRASTVYLANGSTYADALAGGPVAALAPGPLLLTGQNCVPASVNRELDRLSTASIVVLGGTGTAGDGVASRATCPSPPTAPRTPSVSGLGGPAFNDAAPDPDLLRVGSNWYVYSTGTGWGNRIGVLTSPAPTTGWRTANGRAFGSTALPSAPAWEVPDTQWAPGVYVWGGRYTMFYAAQSKSIGHWCLSVATSSSPTGPFVDRSSGPILCQPEIGGSIDPQPFVDNDGRAWLHFKNNDGSTPDVSKVWAVPLGIDGMTPVGSPTLVMAKDSQRFPWQTTVDNPQMVVDAGTYYLFYSSGNWDDASYVVGYAVCAGPVGPCTSASTPILSSYGNSAGTGGGTVAQDGAGNWFLSYHAWDRSCTNDGCGGARKLYVAPLSFR